MIEKMRIPLEEQETVIVSYPIETGKDCEIYTTVPSEMKRLEKMVNKYPDVYKVLKDDKYGYTVSGPWKYSRPKNPRTMTEEQRQKASERMSAYWGK